LQNEIAALTAQVERLTKALDELTPGGSEFHDDPERCLQFIKDRMTSNGKLAAERNELREALTACFEWLENAPFDYNNGNTHEGIDEGNVLGWQTHASLMEIVLHALRKDTE
jgi:hypothetical protein